MSRLVAALSAAAALLALLVVQTQGAGAAGCLTETYVGQLHQADSALRAGAAPRAVLVHVQAAARLDSRASVYLAPIEQDLQTSSPDIADARARLDALDGTLELPPGSTCNVDSTQARNALRNVYSSGVFAGLDQTAQPGVLDRIREALASLISSMSRALGPAGGIIAAAALLLLLGALTWWRVRRSTAGRAAAGVEEPADEGNDPDAEWALALAAAALSDYRNAVRRAFRAALLDVMWRGRLPVDAAWTTRELLASAAGDADLVALLAPAAAAFDRAWYSGAPVREDDWAVMRSRCEAIRRLAVRRLPEPVP